MIRGGKDQEITTETVNTETIATVTTTEIDTKEEECPLSTKTIEEKKDLIEIGDIREVTIILDLILKIQANPAPTTKTEIVEIETTREKKEALIMEGVNNLHKTRMASSRTIIDLID